MLRGLQGLDCSPRYKSDAGVGIGTKLAGADSDLEGFLRITSTVHPPMPFAPWGGDTNT